MLKSVPPDCDDWLWLRSVESLTDIDVSIAGEKGDAGRLHIDEDRAEWIGLSDDNALAGLVKVIDNLPIQLRKKVHVF